jgi:L-ascorbate metabolism protein UlaG (beta-lactamase superfamily)
MKITKYGHCCLCIEVEGIKILTDPGTFSSAQDSLTGIDIILISHEHSDHFHIESVARIQGNNPDAEIIANAAVGKILAGKGIAHTVLDGTAQVLRKGVKLGAHEEIFEEIGQVQNTGYMIAGMLFYPGDSFQKPEREVEILALPIAGPWCKIPDAVRYAIAVAPKQAFPVHDALLKDSFLPNMQGMLQMILGKKGIEFMPMAAGDAREFR